MDDIENKKDAAERYACRVREYRSNKVAKPIYTLCKEHEIIVASEMCNFAKSSLDIMSTTFGLHNDESMYKEALFVSAFSSAVARGVDVRILITEMDFLPGFTEGREFDELIFSHAAINKTILSTEEDGRGNISVKRLTSLPSVLANKPLHYMVADKIAYRVHFHPGDDDIVGKASFADGEYAADLSRNFDIAYNSAAAKPLKLDILQPAS